MAEIIELQGEVVSKNLQIEKLKVLKEKYIKLKSNLNSKVVPKLNSARVAYAIGKANLRTALESKISTEEQKNIEKVITEVDDISKRISNIIISKIDEKIESIKKEIQNLNNQVLDLKNDIEQAEKTESASN